MTVSISGTSGIVNDATDLNYTGTLTGGAGVVNLGSGQVYKDASGNVGIGTTTVPADSKVAISGTGLVLQDASGAIQRFNKTLGTDTGWFSNRSYGWHDGNGLALSTSTADALKFGTNNTERARIDSSGNLLVGTTSAIDAGFVSLKYNSNSVNGICFGDTSNSGTTNACVFKRNTNTNVGTITTSPTSTSYNTSSDYRLKEAIAPMTGALAKVALLKPCTYKWKVDGSDGQGFIAHELAEVEAGCVTGEKDAVDAEGNPQYQGIDTSFLVATLTAAIQEQQTIITALTARITALEAPIV